MKKSELRQIIKEEISKALNDPSNFKLLSRKKDKYEYLLNDENYTTPSGLEFNIKTIGYSSKELDFTQYPKYVGFYYIKTDVYYNGKLLIGNDGIPGKKGLGLNFELPSSIKKAKNWLDNNGEKLIQGKGYQYKSN
jgi:hypothetical protein